jgi:hypothetical protein
MNIIYNNHISIIFCNIFEQKYTLDQRSLTTPNGFYKDCTPLLFEQSYEVSSRIKRINEYKFLNQFGFDVNLSLYQNINPRPLI